MTRRRPSSVWTKEFSQISGVARLGPWPYRPAIPFWRLALSDKRPEPSLDDLLNDPILHALLARDGLEVEEVRRFLDVMKQRLRQARRKAA